MLERQPVPIRAALTVHALEVQLSKVVDLSTETQLSRVGLDMNAVVADDVVVPQRIGGAVSVTGASGLLVPSARLAAVNLVIFVNNLAPGDFFDVK